MLLESGPTWISSCGRCVAGLCGWSSLAGATAIGAEDAADRRHSTKICEYQESDVKSTS